MIAIAQFDSFEVRLLGPSKCRSKPRVRRAALFFLRVQNLPIPGEGTMIDSFTFQIDWIIISVVIGLFVALIGAFLYPRRDLD